MRLFSLSMVVLMLAFSVPARAQSVTPADVVGKWVGGPTDSAGAPLNDMVASDTLVMGADSTYQWTRTSNGKTQKLMVDRQHPTDNHWKRLTSTNISWWGGPGYNIKLEGKKFSMVSVQTDPHTKQHVYLSFTRAPLTPADLVGTWVGGPTDSAGAPLNDMAASDTLVMGADSTYQWTRTSNGKTAKFMVNAQAPTDNHWKRLTSTNISWWGGPGYDIKLEGKKLSMVSVATNRQTKEHIYFSFMHADAPKSKP